MDIPPTIRLGEFWLAWRTDRGEWAICWNDASAGTRRRKSTGCRDYGGGSPPIEAQKAIANHFATNGSPQKIDPAAASSVSRLMAQWLATEGSTRARAEAYSYAVDHLQRWIDTKQAGRLEVSEINPIRMKSYVAMRLDDGVKGETIHGEMAALGRALKWGVENTIIPFAPSVGKVDKKLRSVPKDMEYSMEQVAALIEAAARREDRHHVRLFTLIMLSTHSRVEAVMGLDADSQIKNGLIHFNAPGRRQTSKRRAVVPIAPSLRPWLPETGKVILYKVKRKGGEDTGYYERPTVNIGNAFEGCLVDAGIVRDDGTGWGSPNTLRHTIHTYLQTVGVPQAQIDAAAGHSEPGSGRNYTHLRPEYLRQFIEAIESYWADMDKLTRSHRSHVGPKIIHLNKGKATK